MDVSIIIVNYNTLGLTSDCIDSIADKTLGLEYEIILVDNASTDGSKEVFHRMRASDISIAIKIWDSAGRIILASGRQEGVIFFF